MNKQQLKLFQVDETLSLCNGLPPRPSNGWLATVREALGMTASGAAARAGITAGGWADAERREVSGGITLKTMSEMADVLGCKAELVLIPRRPLETVVLDRVREIAAAETETGRKTMALEGQAPSAEHLAKRLKLREAELFGSDNWSSTLWR